MSRSRDGHQSWCRQCKSERHQERHRSEPAYVARRRETAKRRERTRKYAISTDEFEAMLANQGFCCASCGDELVAGYATHIDHCHTTGCVRAVLCRGCNVALGQL